MSFIISSVLSFLLLYRYSALFVITFFAAFLIPLPSNISVLTAASFVTSGFFNFYFVFLVALAGNILGDLAMYGLARRYGKPTLEKIPFFHRIFTSPKYDEYTKKIQVYAPVTIIMSRFITEVNPLVNIISGVLPITFWRYFKFELIGEILNVSVFSLAGYFLGTQGKTVSQTIIFLAFVSVSTWIIVRILKKANKNKPKNV